MKLEDAIKRAIERLKIDGIKCTGRNYPKAFDGSNVLSRNTLEFVAIGGNETCNLVAQAGKGQIISLGRDDEDGYLKHSFEYFYFEGAGDNPSYYFKRRLTVMADVDDEDIWLVVEPENIPEYVLARSVNR